MNLASEHPQPLSNSMEQVALLEHQVANGTATRDIHYSLARAYDQRDDFERAERHYVATLDTDPDFAPAYHDIGQLYLRHSHPAAAQRAFARYLRIAPTPKARQATLKQLQKLIGEEPLICERCGRTSPIASAFELKQNHLLCPRCRMKKPARSATAFWNHSLFWLGVVGGITLLSYPTQDDFHFFIARFFIVLVYLPFLILIHEAAHAFAALALGGKVYAFIIGQGAVLWRKRIGDCELLIKSDFQNGRARFGFPTVPNRKVRYFIAIAAPLFVHLVLVGIGLFVVDFSFSVQSYAPLQLFVWVNALMFVINAIPRMYRVDGWESASDGATLLKILQGHYSNEELHLASLVNEALAKLDSNRKAEAVGILEKVLAHPEVSQNGRGITENNLSWMLLLQHQPKLALAHAQRAYALLPWHPAIEGTLGAALVETHSLQPGIDHLLQSDEYTVFPDHQASHYAHLALAYAQLGNQTESRQYWEQALALAPHSETIAHIRPKLESIGY